MNQAEAKKWFLKCLAGLGLLLALTAAIVILVDPYFHYHAAGDRGGSVPMCAWPP